MLSAFPIMSFLLCLRCFLLVPKPLPNPPSFMKLLDLCLLAKINHSFSCKSKNTLSFHILLSIYYTVSCLIFKVPSRKTGADGFLDSGPDAEMLMGYWMTQHVCRSTGVCMPII